MSPALNAPEVTNHAWATIPEYATEDGAATSISNVYKMEYVADGATIKLTFARPGVYTIKAGFGADGADALNEIRVFTAEAFGIKVIPTYDENGATADILFNL